MLLLKLQETPISKWISQLAKFDDPDGHVALVWLFNIAMQAMAVAWFDEDDWDVWRIWIRDSICDFM